MIKKKLIKGSLDVNTLFGLMQISPEESSAISMVRVWKQRFRYTRTTWLQIGNEGEKANWIYDVYIDQSTAPAIHLPNRKSTSYAIHLGNYTMVVPSTIWKACSGGHAYRQQTALSCTASEKLLSYGYYRGLTHFSMISMERFQEYFLKRTGYCELTWRNRRSRYKESKDTRHRWTENHRCVHGCWPGIVASIDQQGCSFFLEDLEGKIVLV